MIYKIVLSNGPEVPIRDSKVMDFLKEVDSGKKLILTEFGLVNSSFIVSIVEHKEKMKELNEQYKWNKKVTEDEILGSSPFSNLLAEGKKMLGT